MLVYQHQGDILAIYSNHKIRYVRTVDEGQKGAQMLVYQHQGDILKLEDKIC